MKTTLSATLPVDWVRGAPVIGVDVEAYLTGVRIDHFLSRQLRNYTTFRIQRMVRSGQVLIEGEPATQRCRVFRGQHVQIRLIDPPDKLIQPEPVDFAIIHQDRWITVVNKPADLVVHPVGPFDRGTLAHGVQHYLDSQTGVKGLLRPGIVHRLDRMTSGALVLCQHHLSHRELSIHFQDGRVSKTYLALVEGHLADGTGIVDLPIGRRPRGESILMSCLGDARDRKPAKTRWEVVERFAQATLVRLHPYSGRLHQIRVHMAHLGHPVVGDEYYGPFGQIRRQSAATPGGSSMINSHPDWLPDGLLTAGRHLLHAERLCFAHPIDRDWVEFDAPLAADFQAILDSLK